MRFLSFLFLSLSASWTVAQDSVKVYSSPSLDIIPITANTFLHVSYLQTETFGKVACNGVVFISGNEAVVFDSPTTDSSSYELINWVKTVKNAQIIGVIATHFHEDCVGGLKAFHQNGIESYGNVATLIKASAIGNPMPQNGFNGMLTLSVGEEEIIARFFGEGHTTDNVVGYIPSEKVLFGGCLIKAIGATKGFTGDANLAQWPITVKKIRGELKSIKYVVPGHGDIGNLDLLDYTITLFSEETGKD